MFCINEQHYIVYACSYNVAVIYVCGMMMLRCYGSYNADVIYVCGMMMLMFYDLYSNMYLYLCFAWLNNSAHMFIWCWAVVCLV